MEDPLMANLFNRFQIDIPIVYSNYLQKQENFQKSFNKPNGSDSRNNFTKKNQYEYVSNYRGVGKKIYEFLYTFRNLPFIKLKNDTIARKVGCCTRTVQRWTRRLQSEDLVTINRTSQYDVNEYTMHITKRQAYAYHLNTLTQTQYDELNAHGTIGGNDISTTYKYESVVQSYSFINKYIYITNPYHLTRARDKMGSFLEKKESSQKKRVVRGIKMLQEEQRTWISRNKGEPNLRKVLESEPLKSQIFTKPLEDLAQLLGFNEREKLKLVAFPDETIVYAHNFAKSVISGKHIMRNPIKDVVGWIMGIATNHCKEKKIEPCWKWYFDLCEILKIEAIRHDETGRPLNPSYTPQSFRTNQAHDAPKIDRTSAEYVRATQHKASAIFNQTVEEEIAFLEEKISGHKVYLSDPKKYYPLNLLKECIQVSENIIKSDEQRLKQLRKEASA